MNGRLGAEMASINGAGNGDRTVIARAWAYLRPGKCRAGDIEAECDLGAGLLKLVRFQ
jgi:hypothetical protein